jgi:DNA polymerase-3 subunit epsilon/ATP-dependent DNA helicase DinG
MTTIVAIDIETTGLDSQKDAVTEIAAVRFSGTRVEDEWSTLINPGRHIPESITQLTGISDGMVRNAPDIRDIIEDLAGFVGDAPVLGHNVRFDLGFLQKHRILSYNQAIDTFEMASVLIPSAPRYNLGSLGQQLGILMPATHRALDDARVTHGIYIRMAEMAKELPLDLLEEIVRQSEPIEWDGAWFFQQALQERSREGVKTKRASRTKKPAPLFQSADIDDAPPLKPVDEPIKLDVDEVASALEHGGPFSEYFDQYEFRPEQVEMLRAVTEALSEGYHLMVEAGTGVGKSFAYLVPAAYWAMKNNTRVLVSTNTINLQDQLIKKDLPDLRAALGIDLRAAVLKGRANYLCPRRLEFFREQGPANADEMRVLGKVLLWLRQSQSGDRNEINLTKPAERDIWMHLSAEDDACSSDNCVKRTGGACPFYKAKQAAQTAHILVVNHALLLSDIATGSKVLPDYQYLIVDEAHHLESATTSALSFRLSEGELVGMLRETGGTNSGTLGRMLAATRESLRPSDYAAISQMIDRATTLAFRLQNQARDFFASLDEFIAIQREGQQQNNYAFQVRILPSSRTLPGWDNVEISWGGADETYALLLKLLDEIYKAASDLYANGLDEIEDSLGNLGNVYRRLAEAEINVSAMIHKPSPALIYWVEFNPNNNRITLNAAPLRVGPLIEKYLWHEKSSVVLTSATLTTHGEFDYIRNTLSADETETLALGSPFDYENATLLFVANDMPEPNAPGYEQAINRTLIQLCKATAGRTLVLFTSYAQLKRCSQAIASPLAGEGITVYEQGEGASPNALLESFKGNERAVLLGTRSFWEGVDIPGEALSVLVIAKLPFEVPSDPIIAARSETYENPFNEYQVPEAILKFRQGFGRLIRTASDRGVVAILDRRVISKQYGKLFLESLPTCTMRLGNLADLPREAARWLEA